MHLKTSRNIKKNNVKITLLSAASLLIVLALGLTVTPIGTRLSDKIKNSFSERILSHFKLEEVEWRETSSSNLSFKITSELLWKTSGLIKGQPLFEIKLGELEKRILTLPWISAVQIQTKLTSGLSVQYEVYRAHAIGIRNHKPWLISSDGKWITTLEPGDWKMADLPLIAGFENISEALSWLESFDRVMSSQGMQVHEIIMNSGKAEMLSELQYRGQTVKLTIYLPNGDDAKQERVFNRLKQVVQYLIKNNILVSTIDLRAGQKVVVNVGKAL